MLRGALEELGGQAYLVQQGRENPQAFMTLIGKTLPKELTLDATVKSDPAKLSDAELAAAISSGG